MDNNTFNPQPGPASPDQPTFSPGQPTSPDQSTFSPGQPISPDQPAFSPGLPNNAPQPNFQPTTPISQPQQPLGLQPKKFFFADWSTTQLVTFIIITLLAVTFIGLFIWMFIMWRQADSNLQSQIDTAVTTAVNDTKSQLQADFQEQQKYPYKTFTGPTDYGQLTFEYPKNWSVYISSDAASGSDFEAYLNPDVVNPISRDSIVALRVSILNSSIDQVSGDYARSLESGDLTVKVRPINGENASVYTGILDRSTQGIAAVFKIRDKTAIVQTDAMVFEQDFTHILDTIKYNS